MAVFGRQCGKFLLGDVRRVGYDEVVDLAVDAGEQIRLDRPHAVPYVLENDVLVGELQCFVTDVDQVDMPVRIVRSHGDADAARASAKIQGTFDRTLVQPWRKTA